MSTVHRPVRGPTSPCSSARLSRAARAPARCPSGDSVLDPRGHRPRPEGAGRVGPGRLARRPRAGAATWAAGDEVLVTGRIRRRFFRAGGVTQSRTEVVATDVVPTRREPRRARRPWRAALERRAACRRDGRRP